MSIAILPESLKVRKRDKKTIQPFTPTKILKAVSGAFKEAGLDINKEDLESIVNGAIIRCTQKANGDTVEVEIIQDCVETVLMDRGLHEIAKKYIIYRSKRAEQRSGRLKPDPDAISNYIHPAKYGRYIPELKRRETFSETVSRVENMHLRRFAHIEGLDKDIKKAFDLVRAKKILPSMRSMQFAGAAIEKNHLRLYNCSFSLIDRPRVFGEALFLLLAGCGVGYSCQKQHVEKLPVLRKPDTNNVVHHTIEDSIEGWANALDRLIHSYIKGYYIEFNYSMIREKGAPLKTSGGRAPGHLSLKRALERIRCVLDGAVGRKLRPIETHDIMCHAADSVLSGGIRRSSLISFFSLDDEEMLNAKTEGWYPLYPWRQNANNSVMLVRNEVKREDFAKIFQATRQFGEPGFYFTENLDYGSNPCQPGWATVLTPQGIRTFNDIEVGATIWSGERWTKVVNKVYTGIKPVYEYKTTAGIFYGTHNHRVVSEGVKVEAGDAVSIDIAPIHEGAADHSEALNPQDIMDGLVIGDGTMHKASNNLMLLIVGNDDQDWLSDPQVSSLIIEPRFGVMPKAWAIQTTVKELPHTYDREIPDRFRYGSPAKVRGFLRGLYSANGSIVGGSRITLKATSFKVISAVQEMLSSLGIPSYYTTNNSTEVEFGNGTYSCKQSYDLNIGTAVGRRLFKQLIGFIQQYKTGKLEKLDFETKKRIKKTFDITEVTFIREEKVYDITVDAPEHTYWTGGLSVSNCNEIGLNPILNVNDEVLEIIKKREARGKKHPSVKLGDTITGWSFCNLCEINAAAFKSLADYEEAARAATLVGTLQSTYTEMPYLGWVSEIIAEKDALLGIGMTGICDAPDIALNPEYQKSVAAKVVEWNKEFAQKLGTAPAARTTCVKPSGTTSLELNCVGSGIHPHHARRYFRRVTANELEPVFNYFKSINPHMCVRKSNGDYCIEFPVEAPSGAMLVSDTKALDFLDMVRSTQKNWVLTGTARPDSSPGLNHNVSNTTVVREEEWGPVEQYVWDHRENFTGVSFLPASGDKIYPHAPREAVVTEADEAKWNYLIQNFKPVDYTQMIEDDDHTDLKGEAACVSGACET